MYNFSERLDSINERIENFGIVSIDKDALKSTAKKAGVIALIASTLGIGLFELIREIRNYIKTKRLDRDPERFKEMILKKYPSPDKLLNQLEGFWKHILRVGHHNPSRLRMMDDLERIVRSPKKQSLYENYIEHKVSLKRWSDKYIFAILLDESLTKRAASGYKGI